MKQRTRREFLKISAATILGVGAASLGLPLRISQASPDFDPGTEGTRVVPTFCELCFWKCGVLAHVVDGRVTKLEGNPEHPLSNGKLCPRGAGGVGALYDPDRLKQPLLRVEVNGQQRWKPVSWDEALDHVAEKLTAIKENYGPQSIALYSHGAGGSSFKHLVKAMGSGVIAAPSYDQCRGPRAVGLDLTYGTDVGGTPEMLDLRNSRCVAFLGSHLGENMHNTMVQDMSAANAAGATFITVDPRFSMIASKSRYWLPIKPGTDIALLLAWAQVLIQEGLYAKDFVQANVYGFESFKEYVSDKTPEWAFVHTGIQPDIIRQTARELGWHAPASLVNPGRHATWYGDDTQRLRAIAILNALLGNWGKRGGIYLGNKVPLAKLDRPAYPELKHFSGHLPWVVVKEPPAYDVCEASSTDGGREPAVRAWIVYGCNVPTSLPNTNRVVQVMKQLEFVVAIDTMPAEVTGYADVVLPECTYLERYDDLHSPRYRVPYVALRQPVVEPLHDSRPGYDMAKGIADRMGLGSYFPHANAQELVKDRAERSGLDFGLLKEKGVIVKDPPPIYDDSVQMAFPTATGKVEFVSTVLASLQGSAPGEEKAPEEKALEEKAAEEKAAEAEPPGRAESGDGAGGEEHADAQLPPGLESIPHFHPPTEPPAGYFRLLFGRAPVHTFTRTTNNRNLLKVFPENVLWLNADMARIQGFENGDRVMLVNQDGVRSGPIALFVTQRIRQDCVYMVHGFGRQDKRLRAVYDKGASDSVLVTQVKRDPIMGGTGMNVNFVALERV